ncbi:MAG: PepSY domain-containing protein [Bryobacteraceae bacterium]
MRFLHLCRRVHLYLGLVLLPWFLMYGLSSVPFSHGQYFEQRFTASGQPRWKQRFDKPYDIPVPAGDELRAFADHVVSEHGLSGTYGAYRQGPDQVNVYVWRPFQSTQLKYYVKDRRLVAEDATFRADHFLTGLHAKGGFEQAGFFNWLWGAVVDLVCLAMVLWIVTGLFMWWKLPSTRAWGWVALAGGWVSFALFLWKL